MPLEGSSAPRGFWRSSCGGAGRDSRRSAGTATSSARPALRLPPGVVSARLVARSRRRATCLPTHPPTLLPTYPPTHLPTYPPTHLPTYLPTHLPTHPPTHPPTHLPGTAPRSHGTRCGGRGWSRCPNGCAARRRRRRWPTASRSSRRCERRGAARPGPRTLERGGTCGGITLDCGAYAGAGEAQHGAEAGGDPRAVGAVAGGGGVRDAHASMHLHARVFSSCVCARVA
jgi:hypothetical protein